MGDEKIYIRLNESSDTVAAEMLGHGRARLLEIPLDEGANIFDIVSFDPYSAQERPRGLSFRALAVDEPGGYRTYLAWALLHRPQESSEWLGRMNTDGIVVKPTAWINDRVRNLIIAVPPRLTALTTLALFNRLAPVVEIVCPLLAAHSNDLERAKSDLERVVAWGAPDAPVTLAVAEAFEEQKQWDGAITFWERLANILPEWGAAHERLAAAYAHLTVYPLAAAEFDRAAELADDADHQRRLRAARDLMWERSRSS